MDLADNVEFRNRLVALAEVFDVKLAATRQALYFEALRDVPFPAVAHALNEAVKTCTFFPRPAELRTLALGNVEDVTEAAWMALRAAMAAVGGYTSLVCPDAALGEAVLAVWGTWPAACACELSPEMWAAKRKEFGRVYRVLRERQLDGARYLPGICEGQNRGMPEWQRFIPVATLDGRGAVWHLSAGEAEHCRQTLAVRRHALSRMDAEQLVRVLPAPKGDST